MEIVYFCNLKPEIVTNIIKTNMAEITWESVLHHALDMPGVKVDREKYLKEVFNGYGDTDELVNKTPIDIFQPATVNEVANDAISKHTLQVTALSTAAGIPGGLAMVGTIPADLAQYFWHVLVLAQKLAYIHGWGDLLSENHELDEGAQSVLTVFIGVAMGIDGANKVIRELAANSAKNYGMTCAAVIVAKTTAAPAIRQIAKYVTGKLVHKSVANMFGKFIPLIGGLISGSVTYVSFRPMAKRLNRELTIIEYQRIKEKKAE